MATARLSVSSLRSLSSSSRRLKAQRNLPSHRGLVVSKSGAEGEAAAPVTADPAPPPPTPDPYAMDIRVGRITKVWKHPEADSLYVEEVDVGEEEGPRTICSGLVSHVPIDVMEGALVTVLCNLKPRNMRGIKSFGMLLCASNDAHDKVELLIPAEGSQPGERICVGEFLAMPPEPQSANRVQKKKIWESIQPDMKTDEGGIAGYKNLPLVTAAGSVRASTLSGANIS